jgi:hypothetical protein
MLFRESVRMAIEKLRDESILRFYDAIRREVEADRSYQRKFTIGTSVKQYAEALRVEMTRRRLRHTPIEWHRDR